jgi:peptide/nickel transport system permease protein
MRKNYFLLIGLFIIGLVLIASVFAPRISHYDPASQDLRTMLAAPSAQHPLGTDSLGRDLLARVLWGGRISLLVGFIAVGIACVIGVTIGVIAGFYGGAVDFLLCRFIDIMLCFPAIFLILSVVAILEPNIATIMAVIGLTSWMSIARLIRAETYTLKTRGFVDIAHIHRAPSSYILLRHIIPHALGPVIVAATLNIAAAILIESSLSFLGLGVQPPTPSWGNILADSKSCLGVAWWMALFPGLAIFVTILGFNFIGEGLRAHFLTKKDY